MYRIVFQCIVPAETNFLISKFRIFYENIFKKENIIQVNKCTLQYYTKSIILCHSGNFENHKDIGRLHINFEEIL